jgi:hypothetical protein
MNIYESYIIEKDRRKRETRDLAPIARQWHDSIAFFGIGKVKKQLHLAFFLRYTTKCSSFGVFPISRLSNKKGHP